jgi:hypothetical protein
VSWNFGTPVGYSFNINAGTPPPGGLGQIQWSTLGQTTYDVSMAMNIWTSTNQSGNGSNIGFYYTGSWQTVYQGGPYYIIAYSVNNPGGPGDPGVAATTYGYALLGYPSMLVEAQTIWYYGSLNPFTGQPAISQGAPGYDAAITRLMLHEVGHTMGLTDQPQRAGFCFGQIAGQSVMNANCGTNDSAGNVASNITMCDNQSVW